MHQQSASSHLPQSNKQSCPQCGNDTNDAIGNVFGLLSHVLHHGQFQTSIVVFKKSGVSNKMKRLQAKVSSQFLQQVFKWNHFAQGHGQCNVFFSSALKGQRGLVTWTPKKQGNYPQRQ